MNNMKATIPKPAKILGILGLIPFCIALLSLLHPIFYNFLEKNFKTTGLEIQIIYSIIILCFMSGTFWGFAANAKNQAALPYILSILPTIYVLIIYLYLNELLIPLIGIGFIFLLPIDIYFTKLELTPDWWLKLRVPLSITVFGILLFSNFLYP